MAKKQWRRKVHLRCVQVPGRQDSRSDSSQKEPNEAMKTPVVVAAMSVNMIKVTWKISNMNKCLLTFQTKTFKTRLKIGYNAQIGRKEKRNALQCSRQIQLVVQYIDKKTSKGQMAF